MDRDEAGRLFSHYGFSAFLKRFGLVDSAAASVPAADAGAARIPAAPCADATPAEPTGTPSAPAVEPTPVRPEELAALPAGRWALAFDRESGTLELWNGGEATVLPTLRGRCGVPWRPRPAVCLL